MPRSKFCYSASHAKHGADRPQAPVDGNDAVRKIAQPPECCHVCSPLNDACIKWPSDSATARDNPVVHQHLQCPGPHRSDQRTICAIHLWYHFTPAGRVSA